jgi:sulfite reductase alpha subunit-like flavoprotein
VRKVSERQRRERGEEPFFFFGFQSDKNIYYHEESQSERNTKEFMKTTLLAGFQLSTLIKNYF